MQMETLVNPKEHFFVFQKSFIPPEVKMFNRLVDLVEVNFKVEKCARYYAKEFGMSLKVANTILKGYCGHTISEMIRLRIYQEAVNLLIGADMSMKQIAYELGMCDQAYFTRYIKKVTNCTPMQLRNYYQFQNKTK
jgi:AraC-like DNA-binding protein